MRALARGHVTFVDNGGRDIFIRQRRSYVLSGYALSFRCRPRLLPWEEGEVVTCDAKAVSGSPGEFCMGSFCLISSSFFFFSFSFSFFFPSFLILFLFSFFCCSPRVGCHSLVERPALHDAL